jgi:hypothetical protein
VANRLPWIMLWPSLPPAIATGSPLNELVLHILVPLQSRNSSNVAKLTAWTATVPS